MQTCLHINDFTKHEISRSWYKRADYDKMVDLARKTASKAVQREEELQNELESMLLHGDEHVDADDDDDDDDNDEDDEKENAANGSTGVKKTGKDKKKKSISSKKKRPIEYRGLEAWTPGGAAKVRILKESAIELVWNEQSHQWESGIFDADTIRNKYLSVSEVAINVAKERGQNDADTVQKLIELEAIRKEKKRNRSRYGKSKAVLRKTAKTTGKGLVSGTGKIVSKTGKVGKKLGKRGVKAGVATATLDPRMMKEALKVRINKRESKKTTIIVPSKLLAEELRQQHQEDQGIISNINDTIGGGGTADDGSSNSLPSKFLSP